MTAAADAGDGTPRAGRGGPRSVRRSLASIVLGFETIVVFLGALVTFGLVTVSGVAGPINPITVLAGGAVLCLIMAALIPLLRYPWAYPIGWALQAVVVATGFITPAMFFVGAIFAAMWTYCMINGSRIDNQKEIE